MASDEFPDPLGDEMVVIYLEDYRKKYTIHKSLLCSRSSYFAAAFSKEWVESSKQSIYFAEDDPDAFNMFIYWLYRDKLMPFSHQSTISSYAGFYLLADKFMLSPVLKVQALNYICHAETHGKNFSPYLLKRVIRSTAEDCPLRRLLLDMACTWYAEGRREDGRFDPVLWMKTLVAQQLTCEELMSVLETCKEISKGSYAQNKPERTRYWPTDDSVSQIPRYQIGFLKDNKALQQLKKTLALQAPSSNAGVEISLQLLKL